jgi:hypothetical protein
VMHQRSRLYDLGVTDQISDVGVETLHRASPRYPVGWAARLARGVLDLRRSHGSGVYSRVTQSLRGFPADPCDRGRAARPCHAFREDCIAASTLSGVKGVLRNRTPTAS